MTASGGVVKARLILDNSDFNKTGKQSIDGLKSSFQGVDSEVARVSKSIQQLKKLLQDTQKTFEGLGKGGKGIPQLGGGFDNTNKQLSRQKQLINEVQSSFGGLGKVDSYLTRITKGVQSTNTELSRQKQLIQEATSFAGSNRGYAPLFNNMQSGWTRVTGAANTAGGAIKNVGSRLSEAANSMSMFSMGLASVMGTLGTQQIYNATVGKANMVMGMQEYWKTSYGATNADIYQKAIEDMATQHYQQRATSTTALQRLINTFPIGTDPKKITSLLPIVGAYKNYAQ